MKKSPFDLNHFHTEDGKVNRSSQLEKICSVSPSSLTKRGLQLQFQTTRREWAMNYDIRFQNETEQMQNLEMECFMIRVLSP